ncbi:adenine glycosylase [Photobacterium phosphoreum]|uniref:baseplate complex protein n=1 Tax=Photobacterium phosphoreum TaxID=659 RepID=UPI001E34E960|nr:adenine glycosylase [Photobacterium phosphoreum]MCD9474076.1 adenine glycosylase [Photobacterium phosphoreum]MCD9518156.1 adenine glycosylase [Photobacterium phosphoreum]MCF2174448.1 adenine glycosylase [Photobacterium phosphoreum]
MTLQLNQQSIPGLDIKVTIKLPFGDSDLSGQSSNTTSAETGTKAKELTVSLIVPFEKKAWLTEIDRLAEAINKTTGARTVYRIGHDAANAIKFYEAKFSQELTIRELNDTQGWQVGFVMKEHLSVPERKSQREPIKPAKQQGGEGKSIDHKENPDIPPNTELSTFEKILSMADNVLGGVMGSDDATKKEVANEIK